MRCHLPAVHITKRGIFLRWEIIPIHDDLDGFQIFDSVIVGIVLSFQFDDMARSAFVIILVV